ncbi:MAG: hypothetical protein QW561_05345 [Candidatus Aenigmatarchaeota archaeon]
MTEFKEELSKIVNRIDGCIAAIIIGCDGLIVSQYVKEQGSVDVSEINVELVNIIRRINQIMEDMRLGSFVEFSLAYEKAHILMRAINKDYFLSIIMHPGSNTARGRFIIRTASARIASEF